MSRYIDEISARENFQDVLAYMGSEVKRMLKKIPTADVVAVVRCKDCIFANVEDGKIKCYNTYGMLICTENEYCSRGRRSENGKS